MQNKQVRLVKVLWQHHDMAKETLESKAKMRTRYPHLFDSGKNFEDEIILRGGRGGGGGELYHPKL